MIVRRDSKGRVHTSHLEDEEDDSYWDGTSPASKARPSSHPAGVKYERMVIKRRVNIRKPEMSVNKLSIQEIKEMPVLFGEVDIIKSIFNLIPIIFK